ncbi:MAG: SUMF1/EgtB/PvdO family nonheme iron enzyme [Minicystis sp.]
MAAVFPEAPTWSVGTTSGGGGMPPRTPTGSSVSGLMPAPGMSMPTPGASVPMPGASVPMPPYAPGSVPTPMSSTSSAGGTVALGFAATRPSIPPSAPSTGVPAAPATAPPASRLVPPPAPPATPSSTGRNVAIALGAVLALAAGGFTALRMFNQTPAAGSSTPTVPPPVSASAVPTATASATAVARPTECPKGMVLVPGGKFFMGSDEAAFKLWQPAHKVTLDTFCIDVNEVTAGEYKACSDVGECKRPPAAPDYPKLPNESDKDHEKSVAANTELCNFGKDDRDKHPINCISWDLADAYCKVRKKRLPTEAEWEYAARGSDGRKFPWGDDPGSKDHMNACGLECNKWEVAHGLKPTPRMYEHDDGFFGTAPVGSFPKGRTKFGADDFIGNVWEWTSDWFETYKPDEQVNPKGAPAGERKAIRGGGYNGGVALWLNPAFRYHQLATASAPAIGFRCALTL